MNRLLFRLACGLVAVVAAGHGAGHSISVALAAPEPRVAKLPKAFEEIDGVAAVVGDTIITLAELRRAEATQAMSQSLVPTDSERPRLEGDLRRQILQTLIDNALVLRAARDLGLSVEESEIQRHVDELKSRNTWDDEELEEAVRRIGFAGAAGYRQHVRQELLRMRMLKTKIGSRLRVTEEDVKKVLELEHCGGTCEEEVRARHILIKVPPDASPRDVARLRAKTWALYDKLTKDKADFAALAEAESDDHAAPDGDLGYQRRWALEPSFAAKLWSMKKDELSTVVQTPFGFHLIQLLDRRRAEAKDKDLLEQYVRARLSEDQFIRLYKSWLEEMRRSTHIEVRM